MLVFKICFSLSIRSISLNLFIHMYFNLDSFLSLAVANHRRVFCLVYTMGASVFCNHFCMYK